MSADHLPPPSIRRFCSYSQAMRWLFSKRPEQRRTSLSPLITIAKKLGNPHEHFATVHVAGTNGKGSVSGKIARALTLSGWRTGLFTSPHLHTFCERICIDGQRITPEEVLNLLNELCARIPEIDQLHFFDIAYFLALNHFCRHAIDIAVLEAGIGGRLDATNIGHPLVSIITTIGKDHTRVLGTTPRQIAREKGGIVKAHTPLVLGTLAQNLGIEEIAKRRHAPISIAGSSHPHVDDYNRAVANSALTLIGTRFPQNARALANGLAYRPPGRCELLKRPVDQERWPKAVLLDVAHNPQGIQYLMRSLDFDYPQAPVHLILGLARDKELTPCLVSLQAAPIRLYPTSLTGESARGHSPEAIAFAAKEIPLSLGPICANPCAAFRAALASAQATEIVVACGSFYLIGALRSAFHLEDREKL